MDGKQKKTKQKIKKYKKARVLENGGNTMIYVNIFFINVNSLKSKQQSKLSPNSDLLFSSVFNNNA